MRSVVIVRVKIFVFLMREEGFVRVKSFKLQKPVISIFVGFKKLEPQAKNLVL